MQHCGIPICSFSTQTVNGVRQPLVGADAEWLVKQYDGWSCSKLTGTESTIDLIKLTRDYNACLMGEFGSFIAGAFFPKLLDAHNFYAKLVQEVSSRVPGHRMVFIDSMEGDGTNLSISMSMVPNDLLTEIGIKLTPVNKTASAAVPPST